MRARKAAVLIGGSVLIGAFPYLGVAQVCCDPWGVPMTTSFEAAAAAVVSTLSTSATSIVSLLELQVDPAWSTGFAGTQEHMAKQLAARRLLAQGRVEVMTTLHMTQVAGSAQENGMEAALTDESVTNGAMASEQAPRLRDVLARSGGAFADYAREDPNAVHSSPQRRHAPFCGPAWHAAGGCQTLAPSVLQDADLQVSTITAPGQGLYETLSDDEALAVQAFVRNVVLPVPINEIGGAGASTGLRDGQVGAESALASLAAYGFDHVAAKRVRRHAGEAQ